MSPTIFKVQQASTLTEDTILLCLSSSTPFLHQAGDYIMLGFVEDDLKPFSIACAPKEDGSIELHIRNREDTEFMQRLFTVATGDELLVTGPNKQYQLDEDICQLEQDIILIGGGTGFAPMKALLDELLNNLCTNNIDFYWGVSHQADLYLREDMLKLAQLHGNLKYHEVLSSNDSNNAITAKNVHEQVLIDHPDLTNKRVYLCGAWDMTTTAKTAFIKAGLLEINYN